MALNVMIADAPANMLWTRQAADAARAAVIEVAAAWAARVGPIVEAMRESGLEQDAERLDRELRATCGWLDECARRGAAVEGKAS